MKIEYFSGGCQDKWVLDVLKEKRGGFFVELGGSDGLLHSNTYVLEHSFDWRGILIEPTPYLYQSMIKNRNCFCNDGCVSDSEIDVDFVIVEEHKRGLGGIKNCIRHADKVDLNNTIRIKTRTLESVLDSYNAPTIIDYLSLDVEGSEYLVLKNFPFDKYSFRCITVETTDCNEILIKNGYKECKNKFFTEKTCDMYFIKENLHENHVKSF